MAERRMFAKTIVDSDMFIDMPMSARLLYYDLAMRADDDGFVNSPKKIMKFVGASVDDMNVLIAKQFIIPFESGVVVIKHWKIHNYIQKDRYKATSYQAEKESLTLKNGTYYTDDLPDVSNLDTECIQDVYSLDTQVRLGKDRLGKDRIELGKDRVRVRDRDRERQELENAHAPENLPLEIAENNKNNENDFNNSDNKKPTRHKYGIYKNIFYSLTVPSALNTGSFSRKTISSLSAAAPSARTAILPIMFPPALSTRFSMDFRDSPVLITSSTIRTLLPLIKSISF